MIEIVIILYNIYTKFIKEMNVIFKKNFHIIYIIHFRMSSLHNDEKINNIKPRYLIVVLNDKKKYI